MSSDGVVPRSSCTLAPLSINDPLFGSGPEGELRRWRHELEQAEIFLSILLGDDQTPDPASDGTLHTTLWLPQYLEKRAATSDNARDFIELMKNVLFGEVMKFGGRATSVAKEFSRLKLDVVERLLCDRKDLRSALQEIVDGLDTEIVEPIRVYEGAPRLMELKPPGAGDLVSLVRYRYKVPEQFSIFLSIMLGDPPHNAEPSTTFWFPDVLKKERDCDNFELCFKVLRGPFTEVLKFGERATDVARLFSRTDIVSVEKLLANSEDLRATLRQFNTVSKIKDTEELIHMFITPFEAGASTVDAIQAENLSLHVEPLDDAYIKGAVLQYFGKSELDD